VITGGNNGLGFYMGLSLLDEGHKVAIIDLSVENVRGLEQKYSSQLLYYVCDVRNNADVDKTINDILQRWGRIDVLVNNAALAIFKAFDEKDINDTVQEFDTNYFGYIRMIKAIIPQMKKQGGGIIHNVSSAVGITGFKGIYGYASTKGAIEALTKTLSIELEPYNIQVSLMHPPLMNTKSAAPLGIPPQVMESPEIVGKKLAKRIFSKKLIITPDIKTSIFLRVSYLFSSKIGRFLSKAADNEKIIA
jgi:NAD(P)-dependent dehydrogenase (short-subunit alcohol dehydrogenase family)